MIAHEALGETEETEAGPAVRMRGRVIGIISRQLADAGAASAAVFRMERQDMTGQDKGRGPARLGTGVVGMLTLTN